MILSRLYTNQEKIFPAIEFREGFNVVFARVKDPKEKDQTQHNLGKTFLTHVIDFCLLAKIDKEHPFKQRSGLFGDFVFFMEMKINDNQYVTVRRSVTGRKQICIHISKSSKFLLDLPDTDWEYSSLGIGKARRHLDGIFNLKVIASDSYRKGLTYFLRRQADYLDEFKISKFVHGKHKDWKPYVALILGLEQNLLRRKYEIDDEITDKIKERNILEKKAGFRSEKYDEIKGLIEIKETAVNKLRTELNGFSFYDVESEINEDVVTRIEQQISDLNQERYTLDYELQEIENSLQSEYIIDTDKMFKVFSEAELIMPDSLIRDYEELVDFNKRLSIDRTGHLQQLQKKMNTRRLEIETRLGQLDRERQVSLSILSQKKTMQKFKDLQKRLLQNEEEILILRQQLVQLDEVTIINRIIEEKKQELTRIADQIQESMRTDNTTYSAIRRTFAEFVQKIFNVPASIYTEINSKGNLEFRTRIVDFKITGQETHESRGTSYKKILCACFDLALLSVYAGKPFYRFVYHDGIFEGLDNRIKVKLLGLVRKICDEQGIQYILTVIDSDLPRDDRDRKLMFTQDEIVRLLHDDGQDGRLFKMAKF